MYTNWTGVVPRTSASEVPSDASAKARPESDWQASGLADRNACSLTHDANVIQRQKNTISRALRTSPLFAELSPSAELELCDGAIERSFSNRKVIFREDDPIRFVDIVVQGSVKITQLSPDGGEVILRIERSGSPIDGMGEMSEKVHSTTAWAVGDCRLLSWDASVFTNFMRRFPAIQRNATTIMARRLKALSESFCDLSTARVPQRLARLLLRLTEGDSSFHEPLGLSREELAQMTGTSLFTTSRLLREWAELAIVYVNRRGVLIEDLNALTKLSLEQSTSDQQECDLRARKVYKRWNDTSHEVIRKVNELADGTYDL